LAAGVHANVLHRDSTPLNHPLEITRRAAAKLVVWSSTGDADLFLVLRIFSPDVKEVVFKGAVDTYTLVGQSWLRASHRKRDPQLSEPYVPTMRMTRSSGSYPASRSSWDIEIWPTCILVPVGYRIGLTVRGKEYEYAGEGTRLSNFKNVLRGCGAFMHDDPRDRPAEVYGGTTTLDFGPDAPG
jgi:uncharacterized protein